MTNQNNKPFNDVRYKQFKLGKYLPFCLVLISILTFFFGYVYNEKRIIKNSQDEILLFASKITIGDSVDDVKRKFESGKFAYLKLLYENDPIWCIRLPNTFGPKNWEVWIGFQNKKVVGIKFRYQGNYRIRPKNTPKDLGFINSTDPVLQELNQQTRIE